MRTVRVRAANLKAGDVHNGQRIKAVHTYGRRCRSKGEVHELAHTGVLIVAPNPNGGKLDTMDMVGDKFIMVKRPKYNMGPKRAHKPAPPKVATPKVGDVVTGLRNALEYVVLAVNPDGTIHVRIKGSTSYHYENILLSTFKEYQ